jgi:parvulin-like peptidyl-prolyl isomerase
MYLAEEPPESRAVRGLLVVHEGTSAAPDALKRTRETARERAQALLARLQAGEALADVARAESEHASARFGGLIGTVWPGMLGGELDEFLFSAEVGALSGVLESAAGYHVLQRIERDVAWRQICVQGMGDAARRTVREYQARLRAGEDFGELARAHSADPVSAARGGVVGILQRGPRDALLKAAVFEAPFGELQGPFETPSALYLYERLDPASVDSALRELSQVRARAILVSFTAARGARGDLGRTSEEAEALASVLAERIRSGEDMAELAAQHDDDPGGRERRGDLGWVLRNASDMPAFFDRLWRVPVDELVGPIRSNAGFVIYRRER